MNQSDNDVPVMLSLKDASSKSGLSYNALRHLCLDHRIAHIRIGAKFFVNWDKLLVYMEGGTDATKNDTN